MDGDVVDDSELTAFLGGACLIKRLFPSFVSMKEQCGYEDDDAYWAYGGGERGGTRRGQWKTIGQQGTWGWWQRKEGIKEATSSSLAGRDPTASMTAMFEHAETLAQSSQSS